VQHPGTKHSWHITPSLSASMTVPSSSTSALSNPSLHPASTVLVVEHSREQPQILSVPPLGSARDFHHVRRSLRSDTETLKDVHPHLPRNLERCPLSGVGQEEPKDAPPSRRCLYCPRRTSMNASTSRAPLVKHSTMEGSPTSSRK